MYRLFSDVKEYVSYETMANKRLLIAFWLTNMIMLIAVLVLEIVK